VFRSLSVFRMQRQMTESESGREAVSDKFCQGFSDDFRQRRVQKPDREEGHRVTASLRDSVTCGEEEAPPLRSGF
jgi:hypothetical protein